MSKFETGLWYLRSGLVGSMGRNREDGQGRAYRVPKTDQRGKVRIGNRKSDRNEARVFGNRNGAKGSKGQSSSMGLHRV